MSDGCSGEARDALDETDSICPKGPIRWIIWTEEEMGGCTALPQVGVGDRACHHRRSVDLLERSSSNHPVRIHWDLVEVTGTRFFLELPLFVHFWLKYGLFSVWV